MLFPMPHTKYILQQSFIQIDMRFSMHFFFNFYHTLTATRESYQFQTKDMTHSHRGQVTAELIGKEVDNKIISVAIEEAKSSGDSAVSYLDSLKTSISKLQKQVNQHLTHLIEEEKEKNSKSIENNDKKGDQKQDNDDVNGLTGHSNKKIKSN